MPVRACTCGSAARAAIARPTNSGDSDCRKFESFFPASRQFSSVTPKCSSIDSERRKPGCHGDDRNSVRREFGGPQQRQHLLPHLDRLRHRVPAAANHVRFGHFDDQATPSRHHRQGCMLRGDDSRGQSLPKDRVGGLHVRLPHLSVHAHQRVLPGHAVDDDIEAAVGAQNAPDSAFTARSSVWSTRTAIASPPAAAIIAAVS